MTVLIGGESLKMPSDEEILAAASDFRAALDAIERKHWQRVSLGNFPRGACGHCSELLARYLHERFGITPDYVSHNLESAEGRFDRGHAWLEWNGLLIDISGDQFGWPSVVVTRTPDEEYRRSELNLRHSWTPPRWWAHHCSGIWSAVRPLLHAG